MTLSYPRVSTFIVFISNFSREAISTRGDSKPSFLINGRHSAVNPKSVTERADFPKHVAEGPRK